MISVLELPDLFSDLEKVSQHDGPTPVCSIAYPQPFAEAYDYMRAIWKKNELSERALQLTALCLKMNPANYTVWHYRRQCLNALGTLRDMDTVKEELEVASSLGGSNPKNYQIWYHRRALLESSPMFSDFVSSELEYISSVINEDGKNYHAWSHRQWVVLSFNVDDVWEAELDYTNQLIMEDPRNNSAWNHRWFICHRGQRDPLSNDVAKQEMEYALSAGSQLDPYNESPWRYLIGILKEQRSNGSERTLLEEYEGKIDSVKNVLEDAGRDPDSCVNLVAAHLDILEMLGDNDSLSKAVHLAGRLGTKHDRIRSKYWRMKASEMQARIIQ